MIELICIIGFCGALLVMIYMIRTARIEQPTKPPVIISDGGDEVESIYECTCESHAQRKYCKNDCNY